MSVPTCTCLVIKLPVSWPSGHQPGGYLHSHKLLRGEISVAISMYINMHLNNINAAVYGKEDAHQSC